MNSYRHQQEARLERQWLLNPSQFDPNRSARTAVESERLIDSLPPAKRALDLGTGHGHVAQALHNAGISVDALDIAHNALKRLPLPNLVQACFPYTKLEDNTYDLIVAANLIAELPEPLHRLALSEIARLLVPNGTALLSTPIDIYSDDALPRFLALVETELEITHLIPSHHALAVQFPILKHSRRLLAVQETIGRFLLHDRAISHVTVVGKRCRR